MGGSSCGVTYLAEKSKHLLALDGASDRLQLVAADILTPGVFDSILEGCDGVFHTAAAVPGSDHVISEVSVLDNPCTSVRNRIYMKVFYSVEYRIY